MKKVRKIKSLYISLLWIKVKTLALFSKLLHLINKTVTYESRTGLKEINPVFLTSDIKKSEECVLSPDELYLGIDFLNDNYTLLDTPIKESPHYELMEALHSGDDGRNTEYTARMLKGALDERYEILAYYLDEKYFRNCFSAKISDIHEKSVTVYRKNGRFYIHDGKHRAALCALLGANVKCRIVNFSDVCKEFNPKKIEAIEKKENYKKHYTLLKS